MALGGRNNHERHEALEARNLVQVAKAVLLAASMRDESRSEHYREDFPARGPARWDTPIAVSLVSGKIVAQPAASRR
jgi:succinate dehydrogenase/fumarate reductase flavoprotein subunit